MAKGEEKAIIEEMAEWVLNERNIDIAKLRATWISRGLLGGSEAGYQPDAENGRYEDGLLRRLEKAAVRSLYTLGVDEGQVRIAARSNPRYTRGCPDMGQFFVRLTARRLRSESVQNTTRWRKCIVDMAVSSPRGCVRRAWKYEVIE